MLPRARPVLRPVRDFAVGLEYDDSAPEPLAKACQAARAAAREGDTVELGIECALKAVSDLPFYDRYALVKRRVLTQEYEFWAAGFPGGNNHGPGHIRRVLEYLDQLVGNDPVASGVLSAYELYLAMMAVLYHDVGILRGRAGHADASATFLREDDNWLVFDERDRRIIAVAVASHSSSKDIDAACGEFEETEVVGGHRARPRTVAALVRLADELDEDHRRADPHVAEKLDLPPESVFFWEFCQRIEGIRVDSETKEIRFGIRFEPEDVARAVPDGRETSSFVGRFAQKLAKINRERGYANAFLPQPLRYWSVVASVKPLAGSATWVTPRRFTFTDGTSASEFVRAFPELLDDPVKALSTRALEDVRMHRLSEADEAVRALEAVCADVQAYLRSKIILERSCVDSLLAERTVGARREQLLDESLASLRRWLELGLNGAWLDMGESPNHMIGHLGTDPDFYAVLSERLDAIRALIPEEYRSALPDRPPKRRRVTRSISAGAGGLASIVGEFEWFL